MLDRPSSQFTKHCVQGVPGSGLPPNTLVCYRDALLAKDWPLAWSVAPVLPNWALPPTATWPGLGLQSPPAFETVAEHLHQVGTWALNPAPPPGRV